MRLRPAGYLIIFFTILLLAVIITAIHLNPHTPPIFSVKDMLGFTWKNYITEYVDPSTGKVFDPARANMTTSEGISYTMLRAVWIDDKITFDKTFAWAQKNIQRKDGVFSWLFGMNNSGNYGVLTSLSGQNSASDADTNIALALIFASNRWSDPSYLTQAKNIINGIWSQEVVAVKGTPYMTADNLEKLSPNNIVINPSYLEPYAYRIFSAVDLTHHWMSLVNSSYSILNTGSNTLPSDWLTLDKTTGSLVPNANASLTKTFSYDALRVPWNIALDYEWFKDPRAQEYLGKFKVLSTDWDRDRKLFTTYNQDGSPAASAETPAIYGGTMGYFMWQDPKTAEQIYQTKLTSNYSQDMNSWLSPLSYYDDNWTWFGIALYNHLLPNLSVKISQNT